MEMQLPNCFRFGRVVLILKGRFSGCKAFIIGYSSHQNKEKWSKVLLVGLKRYPLISGKKSNISKSSKKSQIKIFLKKCNTSHVLPTRYFVDYNEKSEIINEKLGDCIAMLLDSSIENEKKKKKKALCLFFRNFLTDLFLSGQNRWFFKKLKF